MDIPTYAQIRLEFLRLAGTNEINSDRVSDYVSKLAQAFNLDKAQMELRTSSGAKKFYSRVNFTKKTLKERGFIVVKDGYIRLTSIGENLLKESPFPINNAILTRYSTGNVHTAPKQVINEVKVDSDQALNKLKEMDFNLFEDLMLEILFELGYGLSRKSIKKNIKKTRDWGLDGYIELDALGLDKVYIQAKRWKRTNVGIGHIQRFSGSIDTKGGNKGVFITTSTFTEDAGTCSELINNKSIRLVDGQELVRIMKDLNFKF
ncbi:restriction endonuclease [Priestia megaterium]|uniref:restriction endonuclease n=1 Tax=Priestia megaterium TaxID=1404 RepID=UPI00300BD870